MELKNLLLEVRDGIAFLTVNRPEKLNALNRETMGELEQAFKSFRDDPNVKAVILTGAGDKAFVAGADIEEISELNRDSGVRFSLKGHEVLTLIETLPKLVIAAVNGFALGGGCELAMACHVRLASENARFGQPEVKLGIIPGYGGTVRLPRLVGKGKAMRMVLSGCMVSAKDAKCFGLVDEVYPQEELLVRAEELAKTVISMAPFAVASAIRSINEGLELGLNEAKRREAELFGETCATEDMKEGTKAFMEKRSANFKGS